MPTCPTPPPVPQEVLQRFRTMRGYDSRMRRFMEDLCGVIPEETDLSGILARLDAIETLLATHTAQIAELQADVNSIETEESGDMTWVDVASTPYDLDLHNVGLLVDTSLWPITINLPVAVDYDGESVYIKDGSGNASTNNITIVPDGVDTIDDDSQLIIDADKTGVELKASAEGWEIV